MFVGLLVDVQWCVVIYVGMCYQFFYCSFYIDLWLGGIYLVG